MFKTTGFISFLFRRISGLALVFYLFTHMWVIGSALNGPDAFNQRLATVQTPLFKIAEVALLAAVAYHAFDGLRLLIVNWFDVTDQRKSMFYAMFAVFAIITLAGGIPILITAFR